MGSISVFFFFLFLHSMWVCECRLVTVNKCISVLRLLLRSYWHDKIGRAVQIIFLNHLWKCQLSLKLGFKKKVKWKDCLRFLFSTSHTFNTNLFLRRNCVLNFLFNCNILITLFIISHGTFWSICLNNPEAFSSQTRNKRLDHVGGRFEKRMEDCCFPFGGFS